MGTWGQTPFTARDAGSREGNARDMHARDGVARDGARSGEVARAGDGLVGPRGHSARIAIAVAVAVAAFVLFPLSPAVDVPLFEVGSVAPENVIAPLAFRVAKAPGELSAERAAAARAAAPVFALRTAALDTARAQLDQFASVTDRAFAIGGPSASLAVAAAASQAGIRLSADEVAYLRAPGRRAAQFAAVREALDRWLPNGVASAGVLASLRGQVAAVQSGGRTAIVPLDSVLGFEALLAHARERHPDAGSDVADALFVKLLSACFRPTLVADRQATERARTEAAGAVDADRFFVRSGEKIVGAHEVVDREAHEKMRALRLAAAQTGRESSWVRAGARAAGSVLYNLVLVAVFGLSLLRFRPRLYGSWRVCVLLGTAFLAVVFASAALGRAVAPRPELVPVALLTVLVSVLFDQRISVVAALVLAALIGSQGPYRGTNASFFMIAAGVAGALSVHAVQRRDQGYRSAAFVGAGYAVAAASLGLMLGWTWREIGTSAGLGAVAGVLSVAVALGLLPAAESFTNAVTYRRLLEWSDLNRPLMQRLSIEAPGTYAHTIAAANLAEAACNAVGADGLLARVGTYYHDIGKLKKPQFFVENQPRGRNPHDKLKPNTSAAIIRNHVREGLELADELGLPAPLRAFITEHHGTGRIGYFLEKARERGDVAPNMGEYAYPGPIPQSVETAVCMLADGVEAAARALPDPTPQRMRDVVEHIVRQRTEQGQLRDAPITLRQLETVKDEFSRVLAGMHHNRTEYPIAAGGLGSEPASA